MDEKNNFSETFQGQLFKYTNVMKGWCPRWFILEPKKGTLDYFLIEQEVNQKPRGTLELLGAVVSPSDEDSHTFTVSAAAGEFYKLRAGDARERQEWVNRLRAVAEQRDQASISAVKSTNKIKFSNRRVLSFSPWENYSSSVYLPATNPTESVKNWASAHGEADQQLRLIADLFDSIQKEIDLLPLQGEGNNSSKEIFQLNATSLLTLHTLQDAIRILENDAYIPSVVE
ncbi:hypothetical protein RUM44_002372 [Polyplax serrata]|uniref:PH domain-containing protein n=1 Tax=Polyplax serrata TaxID=468196 RepID=A0ABR1AMQ7_POLSC